VKRTAEIAGGGIAGFVAALALAQKGWRVRIHERDSRLGMTGGAIYIWENGLRVLAALGVLAPVIADGIRVVRHDRRDSRRKKISGYSLDDDCRLYGILRENLLATLYEAFVETGGEVVFNSRAVAADPCGDLFLADGRLIRADLIVAADGIDSAIRDGLGLVSRRFSADQFVYRAVIPAGAGELEAEGTYREYWSGSRRLLCAPCAARSSYVQCEAIGGDHGSAVAVAIDRDVWRRSFPHLAEVVDRIPADVRRDRFEIVRLKSWSKGKVAILGSAAGSQPPVLGHQVGCTMTSAFSLAGAIDRVGGVIDGLAGWELRERAHNEWDQCVAFWYWQLAFLPAWARIAAFRVFDASKWARRRTLLAAAYRDVTATPRQSPADTIPEGIYPLIH
jgi:2-polyprenyl-6-methoxyphenol hydroxylase-like FAD-dependent oxidoreductase